MMFGLDYSLQVLENVLAKLDITLSALRDGIKGDKTLTDLFNKLDALDNALATIATDKFRVSVVDALPESPFSLTKVAGTSLTGRDWSSDFAKLQNIDISLSTRSSESTLSGFSGKFPSAAALADNLGNPTTTIVGAAALGWDGTYWRRTASDTSGRLRVSADVVANPPGLDVSLSTRASESTLSGFSGKFPSAAALADNLGNPTTTIVGAAALGWDGTYWRRVAVDTSRRLKTVVESIPAIPSGTNIIGGVFADFVSSNTINQTVSTTEVVGTSIDVRRGGRKVIYFNNTQDVSVTAAIEGSPDGTTWFTIRDGISLPANTKKVGLLTDAYGYVRARAVASTAPTTGAVTITVSRMT